MTGEELSAWIRTTVQNLLASSPAGSAEFKLQVSQADGERSLHLRYEPRSPAASSQLAVTLQNERFWHHVFQQGRELASDAALGREDFSLYVAGHWSPNCVPAEVTPV